MVALSIRCNRSQRIERRKMLGFIWSKGIDHRQHVRSRLDPLGIQLVEFLHVLEDPIEFHHENALFVFGKTKASKRGHYADIINRNCHIYRYLQD